MSKIAPNSKITSYIGPVESLESYVRADWWREIFNANYLRTDGDVIEDTSITSEEVDLFCSALNLCPGDTILDLCCGQGRHSLELARRGFSDVTGLDRSHYLITRAKKQAKNEGLAISFREGDARKLAFQADTFDHVLIPGNSFGYFESYEDDQSILKEVFRVAKPGGTLLLDIADGAWLKEHYEPRSWEWIDQNYFVCRERSLSEDGEKLISREVITHVRKGVLADQFYAERLYSRERIEEMLGACGYHDITFHDTIIPKSRKNHDLGMMGRRLVITARVRKEWTSRKQVAKAKRSVTVVMGDPRLKDRVRPSCVFDEDDFYTIEQLKSALSKCDGYSFTYVDNHATLIKTLQQKGKKADFIFNLCDEGYFNDPLRELHIPAVLEMLDIPYTGGNPQCLAYCYDKSLVRGVAHELDIPVPKAFMITPGDSSFIEQPLRFPVIVKPNLGDSSVGITRKSVCGDIEELQEAIEDVRTRCGQETSILVEEFLSGSDISVGIIGNLPDMYEVLPIIEEDYSALPSSYPRICGYEAKWDPSSPYWNLRSVRAHLSEDVQRFLVASCLKLFGRLKCRDYARFDWRLDHNGTPRLLEVNPNPGWCWDGHLAKMAALAGVSYPEMLEKILKSAEHRILD
ncbi:D-alanine--D-alanine ligase [Methanomicrobiaceae archaeon CYW5]|uniref:methyltransferase domain-containing protein n=1 Tax=Methanovulcanius yangii TaxID=1789227 RepID=UPI0029CA1EE1|nr:methyltransferase domain-containing protein [Methanovulcanius yangii]MBT8508925.1 D-alanine--D-alanine ligase [Methanovulcanius yangii]MBT8508939.1 D-alanine--D-alanine ligase [Methanovulcanius yangii]